MSFDAGSRAVVLGGSIAGLFAARVLADAYDEVQIVDRDKLVGVKGPRRFCPQSHQANGLLARGVQVMEELFPGLTQEMIDNGVPTGDLSGSCRWYARGLRLKQGHGNLQTLGVIRPLFEYYIRERVQKIPNVVFVEEHDILGLTATADNSRITGVKVQHRNESTDKVIEADLVIDATGRGSRTPVWLEQLGYERPEEERKKIDLGYVTQHFKLRPGVNPFEGDVAINQIAHAAAPRGNVFFLVEDGRLELTTYGILGDHPPTDQAKLYEWLKSLPAKDVYETLRYADPVDKPVPFKFPTTLRRHYQKLRRFPEGLLVTGDAVTTFNPVYAQGMSVAALCALTLRSHLHSGAAPVPTDYFRDLAKEAIDAAWQMTNTIDLSLPGVPGERSLQVRFANWYLKRVQTAATHDGSITAKYFTAAGLVAPPESLMRPGFMLKVLWKSLFGPSKESRQPYVYKVPEGIEPVVAESAYDETPKAA
ncbi:NAD(P)/FAD-dependent oxidoreductase [Actinophytocola algeriensis]|uniref:2-polyprenyl-6-methoxyphenol hydroxylase-like FAD-dependent oxidoreductase n=1 Tax=Actinophytocola algeriensis TaxID=1768010 RepID=A0A7W7VGI3_9PSEU|nr:FAD-dependent monooxygenase [Actinophytocola algeriensis]MBB4909388.1 2-polyprenyl-6-methoxyphenol hydroxylase-like FAD-dependent oxidoreductase [Actinophytocola algeriensis]MBE1475378.1 2-polyprenyl-6-methoxyphenol hydroxylase-like FAD-dependent oxidoreductase [Actinophytocola algeriensis]